MSQPASPAALSRRDQWLMLVTAFLGWMFAGTIMVIGPLAARTAFLDLGVTGEGEVGRWFSWYIGAFLLGAAGGGLVFGWLGDAIGRSRAMALSILWYSLVTGATYWAATPGQLLLLRVLACLGVGGMWPNGVSLVSEAWPDVSRPALAGLIGTAANVGFVLLAVVSSYKPIESESWRWVMLFAATPAVLGLFVWAFVPESPRWLAKQKEEADGDRRRGPSPAAELVRPPLLKLTIVGILLGTIPLLGGWGSSNWLTPWADQAADRSEGDHPELKSLTQTYRSTGAVIGSLLGGWAASLLGRRRSYFLISLGALLTAGYIYHFLDPLHPQFLYWVFVLGFFGTLYFGWLPYYLPELFPTRVRATGTGVAFNFGRILTTLGVLGAGQLMIVFDGDYARVGKVTSLVFALGMIVIAFAPQTSGEQLQD